MCLTATKRIPNRAIQTVRGVIAEAADTRNEVTQRLAHDILRALDRRKRNVHRKIQTTTRDISREAERTRNRRDYCTKKTRTAAVLITAAIVIATIVIAASFIVRDHFLF
jgi:hypothetical protein